MSAPINVEISYFYGFTDLPYKAQTSCAKLTAVNNSFSVHFHLMQA